MLFVAQILLTVSLNYMTKNHTYIFTNRQPIYFDVSWYFEWEDLPQAFKRWITLSASVRAATQLVSNQELVQMLDDARNQSSEPPANNMKLTKEITASLVGIPKTMLSITPINLIGL